MRIESYLQQKNEKNESPDNLNRMARYLVGIDLGTTNSALAYIDLKAKIKADRPTSRVFPVPQLVAAGEIGERPLLPSFLYLPGPHDLPPGATALPWDPEARDYAVGEFARNHGASIPGRLVTSAKSWLCHRRRRSLGGAAALERAARRAAASRRSRRRPATCGTSSRRGTIRHGQDRPTIGWKSRRSC